MLDKNYKLRQAKKIMAVHLKGSHCQNCNESRHWVLIFHHLREKKGLSLQLRFSKVKLEIDKCLLLCQNCHRELHWNQTDDSKSKLSKSLYLEYVKKSSCSKCGYDKCQGALCFHHSDPKFKEFHIADKRIKSTDDISVGVAKELNKCEVLCSNCHSNHHFDIDKYLKYKEDIESRVSSYKELQPKVDRNLIKQLKNSGLSNAEISKKLKCTKSTVTYALKV